MHILHMIKIYQGGWSYDSVPELVSSMFWLNAIDVEFPKSIKLQLCPFCHFTFGEFNTLAQPRCFHRTTCAVQPLVGDLRNEPYGLTLNFMEFAMLPPEKEKQVYSSEGECAAQTRFAKWADKNWEIVLGPDCLEPFPRLKFGVHESSWNSKRRLHRPAMVHVLPCWETPFLHEKLIQGLSFFEVFERDGKVHRRRWHGCQWWGIGRSVRSITTWPQMFHDLSSSPENPCFGWPNLIVSSADGHNMVVSLQSWWSSQVPKNDFPWFFIKNISFSQYGPWLH